LRHHSFLGGNATCLRCALASDLALLSTRGRSDALSPDTFRYLSRWAPAFVPKQQQCAGEALTLLLDAVDTEDYDAIAHLVTPATALAVKATTCAAEHFAVSWQSCRVCTDASCGDEHVCVEQNLGLQLELPPSSATVLELLEDHFKPERVTDFTCDRCHALGTCEVRKAVTRWPPVLYLHVKRFRADEAGNAKKIGDHLFFEELLVSSTFGVRYSLQAVAVHEGPFGQGHYYAFVRDSLGQWVLVNDAAVPTVVPFDVVQRSQAYLLVFALVAGV
jgi:uncharacterized UBP type Zn finger protein